jgi:hypothetical protein
MKYGNGIDICSNLLMLDSVRELKFMCSRGQDTTQVLLKDWLLYNPLLKFKSAFYRTSFEDHSDVNMFSGNFNSFIKN